MTHILKQMLIKTAMFGLLLSLNACGCNKQDPMEPYNRAMSTVNKRVDKYLVKPLGIAYDKAIPPPIKKGVLHFFDNLWTLPTIANDLLQLQFKQAGVASLRFIFNTTLGIGGLFDVASLSPQLPPHKQDFGHTLEKWGYRESAYFVLPLFGPSTIRDGIGRVVSLYMTPYPYIHDVAFRNQLMALNIISDRADLLRLESVIASAAVDEYAFIRDVYLQKRASDAKSGTFTIGKESGISETFTGEGALDNLEEPPE